MSDTTDVTPAAPVEVHDEDHEHDHPGDWEYIKIAIILAFITFLEVLTYIVDFGAAKVPALWIMMIVKFALVAAFFMHLKYDIRLFWQLFVAGIVLAGGVYLVMLSAFQFWDAFDF